MFKKITKTIFIILEEIILVWMVWYCCGEVYQSDTANFGKFSINLAQELNFHFFTVKVKALIIVVNVITYLSYLRYKVYYYLNSKKKKPKYKYV